MIKRFLPLLLVLAIVISSVAVPAMATSYVTDINGDEYEVFDYTEYIESFVYDGANKIVTVSFPREFNAVQVHDPNGNIALPAGVYNGYVSCSAERHGAALYNAPGSWMTQKVMLCDNIPDGALALSSGSVSLDNVGDHSQVRVIISAGIHYYDEHVNAISSDTPNVDKVTLTDDQYTATWSNSVPINKPKNAKYCSFHIRVECRYYSGETDRGNVRFAFNVSKLQMSISAMQELQEETGKTNELLEQIANGNVTPETPEGSGSVGDLDDLEGGLKDDTSAGRDEANQIIDDSFEPILGNSAGFLFWASVIDPLVSVGWLRGLLTVSLALGIFGFLANIVMIAGRHGRDGRDSKSNKGG